MDGLLIAALALTLGLVVGLLAGALIGLLFTARQIGRSVKTELDAGRLDKAEAARLVDLRRLS